MPDRPNILFLMTDHTNARSVAPGSPCLTPNLDALATAGTRFGRCYTTNAICSPARASLMTALYPSSHGMWDCTHTQRAEWVDVPVTRFRYFSQNLADAGYRNGYFGKWHVEQSRKLGTFGWHEFDTDCGGERLPMVPGTEVRVPRDGYRDYILGGVAEDEPEPHHPAFDCGIEFLRRHAGGDRPFCCFVSASEPHDPYVPRRRFLDMYDIENLELSPTLRDECQGKPEVVRRMREVWAGMTEKDWRMMTAAYWAVITYIDSQVGRIVDVLKETGAYDNTIIVFTSDHGDMLGAHGLCTKGIGTSYEEVYNIPLIVKAPGVPARGEDGVTLTSLVDLAPTLLDLCSAQGLAASQGRSLRPVLEGAANAEDWVSAYGEFFGQRFVYTQRITWHGNWKYVFSPGGIDELYDLASDPYERNNLVGDPACRERLVDMTRMMWRKMAEIGDDSLLETHYATLRTAVVGPESIKA